ncbi:MAG: type III pantothenate kinase [Treponema sp.]|nr:type III pantothenate kinase [Treponema sp.]
MLLCFDIGNTNIKAALFDNEKIAYTWRVSTDTKRTSDEYFSIIKTLIHDAPVHFSQIDAAVISSVIPNLTGPFVNVTQRIINKKPLIVGPDMYNTLPLKIPATAVHEIGTDLLCDALEAWERYKCACIVADFGTALSFTVVDARANIAGVAIAPGIGTAFKSLFMNTAQLPSVPLEIPPTSLGTNTTIAIQSGIVLGYKSLVEGLIAQMKRDLEKETGIAPENVKTIATGGLNSMLKPVTDTFDEIDKELTLYGLYRASLYAKNNKETPINPNAS